MGGEVVEVGKEVILATLATSYVGEKVDFRMH